MCLPQMCLPQKFADAVGYNAVSKILTLRVRTSARHGFVKV